MLPTKTFLKRLRKDLKETFGVKAGAIIREIEQFVPGDKEIKPSNFVMAIPQEFGVLSPILAHAELFVKISSLPYMGKIPVMTFTFHIDYTDILGNANGCFLGRLTYKNTRTDKSLIQKECHTHV